MTGRDDTNLMFWFHSTIWFNDSIGFIRHWYGAVWRWQRGGTGVMVVSLSGDDDMWCAVRAANTNATGWNDTDYDLIQQFDWTIHCRRRRRGRRGERWQWGMVAQYNKLCNLNAKINLFIFMYQILLFIMCALTGAHHARDSTTTRPLITGLVMKVGEVRVAVFLWK